MDFSGPEPIYLQIAQDIREQILAGVLCAGDQVMSTTEYATTYRINPATAAKAFSILEAEGIVYKQRGIGVFVASGAYQMLLARRQATFESDVVRPFANDIVQLGLDVEEVLDAVREAVATRQGSIEERL
ncbi:DNA-binding transcriptional regulator YhcF, GntR family [Bowdeniella nasicola]|uniref:DNA-binding transcriptional regulator YhcF, GntR family n=1 Tax=Bowdeniella nasicola TaxID=208480 RepID=A0A1H4CWI3_9ACTO|nr:GntR family transcriptional regulator [Bowdeniella nasicola]SEA64718.1 DNA-binding transcriptional regulator YhcF, GntR family [Bowdeniella nasicola]